MDKINTPPLCWDRRHKDDPDNIVIITHPIFDRDRINPPVIDYIIKDSSPNFSTGASPHASPIVPPLLVFIKVEGAKDEKIGTAPALNVSSAMANTHNRGDFEALAKMVASHAV